MKKTQNTSIVFLYGNKSDFYVAQYIPEYTGTISATLGTAGLSWNQADTFANKTKVVVDTLGSLGVTVLGKEYSFDIRDNEMFYFVIVQEIGSEKYVEKNE